MTGTLPNDANIRASFLLDYPADKHSRTMHPSLKDRWFAAAQDPHLQDMCIPPMVFRRSMGI
jgi:hypothetical protein